MEFSAAIELESCPRCNAQPRIVRNGQYQAQCACGVCGPRTRTEIEAKRRWRSVVYYMLEHQAAVGEMLQLRELSADRHLDWVVGSFMSD